MAMSPRSPIVRDDGAARDGGGSERGDFRRRAAAALTHPLTLAALAALLVNDIALKRAWPDAWATGKLSDLAWMIFAPPLLAYLLSFLEGFGALGGRARRGALGGLAGFGAAYLGLPLLYAAFNTFEPVHNAALRGLALVGGSSPGTPLDATDSVVIPFAMAAALWVWRRPPASPQSVRARLALLAMAVAALATVATSYPPPVEGVINVQTAEDGTLLALASEPYLNTYASRDGGLTWTQADDFSFDEPSIRLETPLGTYAVARTNIRRTGGGERGVIYSAERLNDYSNVWARVIDTRERGSIRRLTRAPLAIAYDEVSGNVAAAMGMQGVVAIAPDGSWRRVAVGPFEPTDFSFAAKLSNLRDSSFLWLAFALAVSFTGLGMGPALLAHRRGTPEHTTGIALMAAPAAICSLFIIFAGLYPSGEAVQANDLIWRERFSIPDLLKYPVGGFALIMVFSGVAANRPNQRQALIGVASMVGMLLLVLLAFTLWLQVNSPLRLGDVFALLFVGLAALALHSIMACSARGAAQDGSAAPG